MTPAGETWRRRPARRYRLGFGRDVVCGPWGELSLPSALADAIQGCEAFLTVREHAERLWSRARASERAALAEAAEAWLAELSEPPIGHAVSRVERALELLAGAGLLLSRSELLPERVPDHGGADAAVVGVAAEGDPERLSELLDGLARAWRGRQAPPRLVVADAGDGREAHRRQRAAAAARASGTPIEFLGARELGGLAAGLAAAGADARAVRSALSPSRGGARNALLLRGAGSGLILLDDGLRPRLSAPPGRRDGVGLFSDADPRVWAFGPACAAWAADGDDLLSPFDGLLGARAAALAARARDRGALELDGMGDGWPARLAEGSSRVRLACLGAAGSGLFPRTIAVRGARGLFADAAALRAALEGGETACAAPVVSLRDRPSVRSRAFGLDARRLLPPFLPGAADSRRLFAELLAAADPDACFAELPAAAAHATPLVPEDGPRPPLASFVAELLSAWRPPRGLADDAGRLEHLAEDLGRLASRPAAEWARWARNIRWNAAAARLRAGETTFAELGPDAPPQWRREARARLDAQRAALVDPGLLIPREVGPSGDVEAGRRLVLETADLLRLWPSVWRAASADRLGQRLAV